MPLKINPWRLYFYEKHKTDGESRHLLVLRPHPKGEYSKVPILKIINFKNPGIIVWINGLERKRWLLLWTELCFPLCWNSTSLVTQQKKLLKQTLQFKPIKGIKKFFFSIILKTKWKLNCNNTKAYSFRFHISTFHFFVCDLCSAVYDFYHKTLLDRSKSNMQKSNVSF